MTPKSSATGNKITVTSLTGLCRRAVHEAGELGRVVITVEKDEVRKVTLETQTRSDQTFTGDGKKIYPHLRLVVKIP